MLRVVSKKAAESLILLHLTRVRLTCGISENLASVGEEDCTLRIYHDNMSKYEPFVTLGRVLSVPSKKRSSFGFTINSMAVDALLAAAAIFPFLAGSLNC